MRLPVWLSVITLHATLYRKRRVKREEGCHSMGTMHECGTHFIDLFDSDQKLRADIGMQLLMGFFGKSSHPR